MSLIAIFFHKSFKQLIYSNFKASSWIKSAYKFARKLNWFFNLIFKVSHLQLMFSAVRLLVFCVLAVLCNSEEEVSCQIGSVIKQGTCVKCFNLPFTADQSSVVGDACSCEKNYLWSVQKKACVPQIQRKSLRAHLMEEESVDGELLKQESLFDQDYKRIMLQEKPSFISNFALLCSPQNGFIVRKNNCINCKALQNSLPTAKSQISCECQASYEWTPIWQVCQCITLYNYTIDSQVHAYINGSTCTPCWMLSNEADVNYCKVCKGGIFGFAGPGCLNCSAIMWSTGATLNHSSLGDLYGQCTCRKGYYFNSEAAACLCASDFYYNGAACINCSTFKDTVSQAKCKNCSDPFIFDGQHCRMGKLITNFNASSYTCSIGYELKSDLLTQISSCICAFNQNFYSNGTRCLACSSIPTTNKSVTTAGCLICNQTQGFYLSDNNCIFCLGMKFSKGAGSGGCICNPGYFWNSVTSLCECDWGNGFIPSANGTCLNCSSVPLTVLPAYRTLCRCPSGYIFNLATKKCECDTKGSSVVSGSKCVSCIFMYGSISVGKNNTCNCISGFYWNITNLNCVCDTRQNFYSQGRFCLKCSSVQNSNGFASVFGCICKEGYRWMHQNKTCDCPLGYAVFESQCLQCSTSSLPSKATISGCQICDANEGFIEYDGICFSCEGQVGTTGNTILQRCECVNQDLMIWDPMLRSCVCNYKKGYYNDYDGDLFICSKAPSLMIGICPSSRGYALNIFSQSICTKCANFLNSNRISNGSDKCGCNIGFSWKTTTFPFTCQCSISTGNYLNNSNCNSCSFFVSTTKLTKAGCLICDQTQGFLFDALRDQCLYCPSYPNTDGTATLRGCGCKSGNYWDQINFQCITLPSCLDVEVYDYLARKCVCDLTKAIFDSLGQCVSCKSYGNSNGIPTSSTSCGCVANYTWSLDYSSGGSCICLTCPCNIKTSYLENEICINCANVQYSSGLSPDQLSCICKMPLFWFWDSDKMMGTCLCSDPIQIPSKNGTTCICNPAFAIPMGSDCLDCNEVAHSFNVTNSSNTSVCKCLPNFSWISATSSCQCLAPFQYRASTSSCLCPSPLISDLKEGCVCNSSSTVQIYIGYCFSCLGIPMSTGRATSNGCECISNLIFSLNEDGTGVCGCDSQMTLTQDKTRCICQGCVQTCNHYIGFFKHTSGCLNCRLLKYSSGSASYSQDKCNSINDEHYWKGQTISHICAKNQRGGTFNINNQCKSCLSLGNLNLISQCQSCTGIIFAWTINGCVNCQALLNGIGASNGSCLCQRGYYFHYFLVSCICDHSQGFFMNGTLCLECSSSFSNSTNLLKCQTCTLPFFYDNQLCTIASFIPNLNINTSTCLPGFSFKKNPLTLKIISCACSFSNKSFVNGSQCIPCSSAYLIKGLTTAYCLTCNSAFGLHLGLTECIYCKNVRFSTGLASVDGCSCLNFYFWNALKSRCECDQAAGYYTLSNGDCGSCRNLANSDLPASLNGCSCKKGYIWNSDLYRCDCDLSLGFFNSSPTCISCLTLPFTLSGVLQSNGSCLCQEGTIWDPTFPRCVCNFNLNYVLTSSGCLHCKNISHTVGVATAFGCVCQPGYSWTLPGYCSCARGYYRLGKECLSCRQMLPVGSTRDGCTTCDSSEGYVMYDFVCFACSGQIGASGVVKNNWCICKDSVKQIWNPILSSCVCNYAAKYYTGINIGVLICILCEDGCNSCTGDGFSYNPVENECLSCSAVRESTGNLIKNNVSQCECVAGFRVNYKFYPPICQCSYKQGSYLNGEECLRCQNLPFAGKLTLTGCLACSSVEGFLYNSFNDTCLLCPTAYGTNGIATASGCVCQNGEWDSLLLKCVLPKCPLLMVYSPEKHACDCDPTCTIENQIGNCISCNSFINSNGKTIFNMQYNRLECACAAGYRWQFDSLSGGFCVCSYPLLPNSLGGCNCDSSVSIQIGINQCFLCTGLPRGTGLIDSNNPKACDCQGDYAFFWNSSMKSGTCGCKTGMYLNVTVGQCICDMTQSIFIRNVCIACSSIPFSNNISNNGKACGCIISYEWNALFNNCTCNSTTVYAPLASASKCIACKADIFAKQRISSLSCSCLTDSLIWQNDGFCGCGDDSALVVNGNNYTCLICDETNRAVGKNTTNSCYCKSSFVWSGGKCDCPINNSFLLSAFGRDFCITCNISLYAKSKGGNNSCVCVSIDFIWRNDTYVCQCNDSKAVPFFNISNIAKSYSCIPCDISVFAKARRTTTSCICVTTDFVWRPLSSSCQCSNTASAAVKTNTTFSCIPCDATIGAIQRANITACKCYSSLFAWSATGRCLCIDNNSILLSINGNFPLCIPCNSFIYASEKLNLTACKCMLSILVWQADGYCDCGPKSALIVASNKSIVCRTCNFTYYASEKNNSTSCSCIIGGFEWNGNTCACPISYIITTYLTCFACKSGVRKDLYLCQCDPPYIWDDIRSICVKCGSASLPKSTNDTYGGIVCGCVKDYVWSVMTNQCVPGCLANTITCMNCGKILNLASKAAMIGKPSTYRNLSGGVQISNIYLTANTNYKQLMNFACNCASTHSWDGLRRRCFDSKTLLV